jgi:FG-GAP repeat
MTTFGRLSLGCGWFTTVDQFGYSVVIDGDAVVIGAPFDDSNSEGVGQATLIFNGDWP